MYLIEGFCLSATFRGTARQNTVLSYFDFVIPLSTTSLTLSRMNVANIMQITYEYEIQEGNDPFVQLADQAAHDFTLSTTPGTFSVNLIPIYWFPGAGLKQTAKEWRSTLHEMVKKPYNYVKQRIATGDACYSFTSSQLKDGDGLSSDEEFDIKWTAAALYIGGSHTTVASISAFFKAMLLYPDIQATAQAEIDAIIGTDRLPRCDDRERLPYINALALEVSRWHTVGPLGLPHSVSEDDVHSGYFIPKGSVVLANIWYDLSFVIQMLNQTEKREGVGTYPRREF
ncbi:cytochrome P450 [Guyanagaster necrorhizus]|uniref:Cytochrome P450 n=1 Tax=Guyanagaster necrorhizus TaxID=856835 RepID=A0A9P7W3C9_9AGAR|nr:cytochrome P450 [Guyanagaster necrorhizus MCA 3950]KAG7451824.1 cytochrome P450 [Guyanagaster necrorhizus MCA 3950]